MRLEDVHYAFEELARREKRALVQLLLLQIVVCMHWLSREQINRY